MEMEEGQSSAVKDVEKLVRKITSLNLQAMNEACEDLYDFISKDSNNGLLFDSSIINLLVNTLLNKSYHLEIKIQEGIIRTFSCLLSSGMFNNDLLLSGDSVLLHLLRLVNAYKIEVYTSSKSSPSSWKATLSASLHSLVVLLPFIEKKPKIKQKGFILRDVIENLIFACAQANNYHDESIGIVEVCIVGMHAIYSNQSSKVIREYIDLLVNNENSKSALVLLLTNFCDNGVSNKAKGLDKEKGKIGSSKNASHVMFLCSVAATYNNGKSKLLCDSEVRGLIIQFMHNVTSTNNKDSNNSREDEELLANITKSLWGSVGITINLLYSTPFSPPSLPPHLIDDILFLIQVGSVRVARHCFGILSSFLLNGRAGSIILDNYNQVLTDLVFHTLQRYNNKQQQLKEQRLQLKEERQEQQQHEEDEEAVEKDEELDREVGLTCDTFLDLCYNLCCYGEGGILSSSLTQQGLINLLLKLITSKIKEVEVNINKGEKKVESKIKEGESKVKDIDSKIKREESRLKESDSKKKEGENKIKEGEGKLKDEMKMKEGESKIKEGENGIQEIQENMLKIEEAKKEEEKKEEIKKEKKEEPRMSSLDVLLCMKAVDVIRAANNNVSFEGYCLSSVVLLEANLNVIKDTLMSYVLQDEEKEKRKHNHDIVHHLIISLIEGQSSGVYQEAMVRLGFPVFVTNTLKSMATELLPLLDDAHCVDVNIKITDNNKIEKESKIDNSSAIYEKIKNLSEQTSDAILKRREIREMIPPPLSLLAGNTPREAPSDFDEKELDNTLYDLMKWEKELKHQDDMLDYKPVCVKSKSSNYHMLMMKLRDRKYLLKNKRTKHTHWLTALASKYVFKGRSRKLSMQMSVSKQEFRNPLTMPPSPPQHQHNRVVEYNDQLLIMELLLVLQRHLLLLTTNNGNAYHDNNSKQVLNSNLILLSPCVNDHVKVATMLLLWHLCEQQPGLIVAIDPLVFCVIWRVSRSHLYVPRLRSTSLAFSLWLKFQSGYNSFTQTIEEYTKFKYYLEVSALSFIESLDRDLLLRGFECISRLSIGERGNGSKQFVLQHSGFITATKEILQEYVSKGDHEVVVETVLRCLLNLSTLPAMQVKIAKHLLPILLSIANKHQELSVSLFENLSRHFKNRTLFYKMELATKNISNQYITESFQIYEKTNSANEKSFFLTQTEEDERLRNFENRVKVKSNNLKDKFMEWCDRLITPPPLSSFSEKSNTKSILNIHTKNHSSSSSYHVLSENEGRDLTENGMSRRGESRAKMGEEAGQSIMQARGHSPLHCDRQHERETPSYVQDFEFPAQVDRLQRGSLHERLELNLRTLWGEKPSSTTNSTLNTTNTIRAKGKERWEPTINKTTLKARQDTEVNNIHQVLEREKINTRSITQNVQVSIGVNEERGKLVLGAPPCAPSLIPKLSLHLFKHTQGSKVHNDLKSFEFPDGKSYHMYYKDSLNETIVKDIESVEPPPLSIQDYNSKIFPPQFKAVWPTL